MTDRELRKLSRLELLEMLLDVSKENEALKEKTESLTREIEAAKSIENLAVTTNQLNDMLRYADRLTKSLKSGSACEEDELPEKEEIKPSVKASCYTDRNLYVRLLSHFIKDRATMDFLPDDLKTDIGRRIDEILEGSRK